MEFLKNLDLDALPKKKYLVIKYILDHPEEVILMNTADLARKLNVDPVTIIKACQEIGLKGFHDIKKQLKSRVASQNKRAPFDKFLSEFEVNTSTEQAIRNALTRDVEMLTKTIEKVSFEKIIKASEAIIASRNTYIIGLGYIGAVSNYLQSLLRSHIPQLHSITEYNGMLFDYMGLFRKDDVVIAIGFDKCQNQTIKAFKKARDKGCTTIVLTDSEYSPLCTYSKIELFTYTAPNYFLSPLIGAFSLCNALLHCVVELMKPQSIRRSADYNKLLEEENVYYQ
ncbi:MAG TPA: MurR/RpiR family transcriptional regulator [Flavitalea sp.]|nr:MurR/RpiR family transcriptional regulator [Flavitalea sp.]